MGHWESVGLPEEFDGHVRLFPLPNLVLFPRVIQALHIFEPRYCEMLTDALESDQLITMALLVPGWESSYENKPSIAEIVCIGRIISHTPTMDGRHNILLAGIQRAKIVRELPSNTTYRQAIVEVIPDIDLLDVQTATQYRENLLSVFRTLIPLDPANSKSFSDLLTHHLPLGILTDIIGYAINLPVAVKQELLGQPNVELRYDLLMQHLIPLSSDKTASHSVSPSKPIPSESIDGFLPPFSDN